MSTVSASAPRPGPRAGGLPVNASLSELLGMAGLPVAVHPEPRKAGAKPRQTARDWDRRIGVLVHQVIAELVPLARDANGVTVGDLATEVAARVVRERTLGNLAKARGRVAGMASLYVQRLAPPASTAFLGSEVPAHAGGVAGRVDLAWEHPELGVFYDEVKAWQQVLVVLDDETTRQVVRYLDAGMADHGERFAGVRLLTLSAVPRCLYVDRQGTAHPLVGSPLCPAALRTEHTDRSAA